MRNPMTVCRKCGQAVNREQESWTMTGKGIEHQDCPPSTQDVGQARRDLDQAREAHAAALVACLDAPSDPDAARAALQAVQQGRGAWKGYQKAATAGLADQISAIVPGEFQ